MIHFIPAELREKIQRGINHSPELKLMSLWLLTVSYFYVAISAPLIFPWELLQPSTEVHNIVPVVGGLIVVFIATVFCYMGLVGLIRSIRINMRLDRIQLKGM